MRDCSGLLPEPKHFDVASRVDRDLLHIPAFPALSPSQLDHVASAVEDALDSR